MRQSLTVMVIAACLASPAAAQPDPPPVVTPDPPPVVKQLADMKAATSDNTKRIEQLRAELAVLRANVIRLEAMEQDQIAAPPPAAVVPPRLWTVNTHPGKTFTEDQLRAMYPGHRFPFDSAPEVAGAADPFAECGAWGCPTTRTTNATAAGRTNTSWTVSYPAGDTFIRVGGAVILGGTSGCASGNCAAASATYAPQWRLRR